MNPENGTKIFLKKKEMLSELRQHKNNKHKFRLITFYLAFIQLLYNLLENNVYILVH